MEYHIHRRGHIVCTDFGYRDKTFLETGDTLDIGPCLQTKLECKSINGREKKEDKVERKTDF